MTTTKYLSFPNCNGCKREEKNRMKCPKEIGLRHFKYKEYFSVVVQGITDENYKFIALETGANDKQSYGATFPIKLLVITYKRTLSKDNAMIIFSQPTF